MQDVIIESSNQSSSLAANVRKVTIKNPAAFSVICLTGLSKGF